MELLTIGALAKKAAVNTETIRYYQRIGLLDKPAKPATGFRSYSLDYLHQLHFIQQFKALGFALEEIREIIALGQQNCCAVRTRLEAKKLLLLGEVAELEMMINHIDNLITGCLTEGESGHRCPAIESLSSLKSEERS